ncbi:MAG: 2-keto-3-deoxy-phosphogluconate aldolase [Burkholderiales bacterium]|jgi:2-dehydro-3-deoxyphosphogluconate aldolase/(4S)-4-hydroxy-2-oxoglutarate aldolase|nr:2-keto-3-deoxy-phosphogluconate aldolase [Burkholderiales bacterium]
MQKYCTCEELLTNNTFIPVVVLDDISKAVPLAQALLAGGVKTMEITLRTKNALAIIETISKEVPDMLVGAGTVLNFDQYHLSIKHGAKFIVSPGLTNGLIETSRDYDAPFLPGAVTPTEVMLALEHGFNYLKFFPAENYNGVGTLKAFASVFSQVKFCPTGGITLDNAKNYLSLSNVLAVGCSFLAPTDLIKNNDFAAITELASKTKLLVK